MGILKRTVNHRFIIIIIAAIIFNFIYFNFVYKTLIEIINDSISNTLSISLKSVDREINEKITETKNIIVLAQLNDEDFNTQQRIDLLAQLKENERRMTSFIAELDGKALSDEGQEVDFADYEFFKTAKIGTSVMGEPFYSDIEKRQIVPVAVPIRNAETNKIENVLISYYNINVLRNCISSINIGTGTISMLIDKSGNVVSSNRGELFVSPMDSALSDMDRFIKGTAESESGKGKFVYGESYVYQYAQVSNGHWVLAVSAPASVLYRKINIITFIIVALSVLIVATVLVMGLYTKWLSRRLKLKQLKINDLMNKSLVVSITTDRDYNIIDYNDVLFRLLGYTAYELKAMNFKDILPENYKNDFYAYMEKFKNGESLIDIDVPLITKDGKIVYVLWNAEDFNMTKIQFVGIDVSKLKEYEEEVRQSIFLDSLTGFYNSAYARLYFRSIQTKYRKNKIAFIYIDIDNFKYINDVFGHDNGDEFIKDICNRLSEITNENGKIFRQSGDELIAIYHNASDKAALDEYISNINEVISADYYIDTLKTNVTASIGVSVYPDDGSEYSEIIKAADIAMNSAKQCGKAKVQFFNERLKNDMLAMLTLEKDLKKAIVNSEFVLYYQPQYDIETGRLYGFEALIRWDSPEKGLVSPGEFIPFAEKSKMIIEIGTWALEEACIFINKITKLGYDDICISVNVSVIQMMCDDYVEKTLGILKKHNIRPDNIKLEITESVLMESIEEMLAKINILSSAGIHFALDDFGTGYSSLTYLKKIPLEVLKIDKTFVDMIAEQNDNKIISAIIDLAHDINLEVVAEGIEEDEQLEWLKAKGCNIAQGFYMGKPMPEKEAIEELGKNMYEQQMMNKQAK